MSGMHRLVIALVLGLCLAGSAVAVQPDEVLANPALEHRAREISGGLRCLVCQNQSIDDSDAPLARDLRLLVRERLVAGDSDKAVTAFVVARYGDFVLLSPPVNLRTIALWTAPFLILLAAFFFLWRRGRTMGPLAAGPGATLSEEEAARLDAVLKQPRE